MRMGLISTIGNAYSWAGSEETWRLFAAHAVSKGHQLDLLVPDRIASSKQAKALETAGVRVNPRGELNPLTRRMAARGMYSRFKRFFKEPHDCIFISTGGIADCAWLPDLEIEIQKYNKPLIFFIQSNAERLVTEEHARDSLRKIYGRAALVIFLSRHNRLLAERQLGWYFPKTKVMMNPLREAVSQKLAWPENTEDTFSFASVSRLELADKMQDQLLEALSASEWKARNWRLTLFGDGPDRDHLARLIQHFGLQERAILGGFVADFREIWRSHHLHLLTSYKEGMPLALIESMFCGRPAIVTRAGGNAELVTDGVEGFVSPGMHPEIIRETLERAWQAREHWVAMGDAAHRKVARVVDPDWPATMLKTVLEVAAQ